jgi:hypothetical protein
MYFKTTHLYAGVRVCFVFGRFDLVNGPAIRIGSAARLIVNITSRVIQYATTLFSDQNILFLKDTLVLRSMS